MKILTSQNMLFFRLIILLLSLAPAVLFAQTEPLEQSDAAPTSNDPLLNEEPSDPFKKDVPPSPNCLQKEIYFICEDPEAFYNERVRVAKKKKKKMIVVFGADWCGWCKKLNKRLKNKLFSEYEVVEIAMMDTKNRPIQGSEALFSKLSRGRRVSYYPTVLMGSPEKLSPVHYKVLLRRTNPSVKIDDKSIY